MFRIKLAAIAFPQSFGGIGLKWLVVVTVIYSFISSPFESVSASSGSSRVPSEIQSQAPSESVGSEIETKAFRSGRRTYRAPTRSGNTGVQAGTNRSQRPGAATPVTRAPASRWGGFGGFFGGMLAGSLLGSLFNPFGYGGIGFGGINLLSVLIWAGLLYVAYRLIRRMLVARR